MTLHRLSYDDFNEINLLLNVVIRDFFNYQFSLLKVVELSLQHMSVGSSRFCHQFCLQTSSRRRVGGVESHHFPK